jgi:site-specific recombinase XerD
MADAGIHGAQACPKGLRHGYGIHAIQSGVPVTLLQKWLGHASLSTTAIYTNALGAEELYIAERMWV